MIRPTEIKERLVNFFFLLCSINRNCLSLFALCRIAPSSDTASRSGLLRSPRKSSSVVMPKISAIDGIRESSGVHSSHSHRLTVLSETKSRSPSSLCVMPFALRRAAMNLPIVFFSIEIPPCLLGLVLLPFYHSVRGIATPNRRNFSRDARTNAKKAEKDPPQALTCDGSFPFTFGVRSSPRRSPWRP